ncbi:ABC transporter permease [Mycoplasma buteonis]|uniref:ABC transporter permease n=1 Tax=Mycoplasma buteonis TaxID=171280 RepID=UPI00056A832D|nr:ABC transporter permease [Mycoplasma buteonis]
MLKYISQRIFFALLTLIIIIFIVFMSVAIFSDNPFAKQALNTNGSGADAGEATAQKVQELFNKSVAYHLVPDVPYKEVERTWFNLKLNPFIRMAYWFKDVFDSKQPFGLPYDEQILSVSGAKTIPEYFFKFLKFSIIITLPSFLLSAIIGISLGIVAGYKRGSYFDVIVNFFSLLFVALPSFVLAPILISILLKVGIQPLFLNPSDANVIQAKGWNQVILSWLPPILIIVLGSLSGYISYTRNQVVSVLTSNYVLIARSKGLSTTQIFFKYVFRNISIPLAAAIIPSYIGLLSGGIIIETYWRIPGTSTVLTQAFPNGEINLIMFSTVLFTFLGLMTSILVDIVFVFLDPRIKYGSASKYNYKLLFTSYLQRQKQFKEYQLDRKEK